MRPQLERWINRLRQGMLACSPGRLLCYESVFMLSCCSLILSSFGADLAIGPLEQDNRNHVKKESVGLFPVAAMTWCSSLSNTFPLPVSLSTCSTEWWCGSQSSGAQATKDGMWERVVLATLGHGRRHSLAPHSFFAAAGEP